LRKLPGEVAKRLQILKTKSSGYFLNFYGMTMTWMTENLHQHIALHFGKDTLGITREYEKLLRKLADYRNHLRFNLRCRQQGLIPNSLRLKSTIKGHRAEEILRNAHKKLLSERIRQTQFTIEAISHKIDQTKQKLSKLLPETLFEEVARLVNKVKLSQHHKTKERQKAKFKRLQQKAAFKQESNMTQEDNINIKVEDKWVKNLSSRPLTKPEMDVLSKGLNFAIAPQEVPIVELITATESAIRNNNLAETEAEQLRMKVTATLSSAKPPPSNLTPQEMKAITSLSQDQSITILPADKGRCTVVLNTSDYQDKIITLLKDNNTYESLKRDPTSGYKRK